MEYITGIKLQDIFLLYWDAYCNWYKGTIREAVYENVKKIMKCRTFQLGYHMFKCPKCSTIRLMPHSCKSRFCSSCGKIATDKWTEERLSDVLSVEYHHLVFTVPWQLRSICMSNRQIVINILFAAVALSLMSWTKANGGYIPGIYAVLHTFGSDIKFNPHLHILITAGGLSLDRKKWISAPDNYLMPARQLLPQNTPKEKSSIPDWRERQSLYNNGQDPLICENCATEMELVAVVFWKPDPEIMKKPGYKYSDRIPMVQFQSTHDTS